MDDLLREFLTETHESLDTVDVQLVRFEQEPNNAKILDNIFRLVHTIKGTCGFLGLPRLEALAHAAETLMGKFRDGTPATSEAVSLVLATIDRVKDILEGLEQHQREPQGDDADLIADLERMARAGLPAASFGPPRSLETAPHETAGSDTILAPEAAEGAGETRNGAQPTIRVTVDTLEHLMTMVSELVLTRNQLLDIARQHEENSAFKTPLQRLSNVTAELQESVMKTRMQPIANAWQKLPRIVRDLARELDKDVEIDMQGEQTELDRQVLDLIKDPLTHMVRNSVDHGMETRAERIAAGKSAKGHLRLLAYHEGGQIVIEVADDGRGLDTGRIGAKALSMGIVTEDVLARMSEQQIHKLIFEPGFSTADKVTSISGRGVGMDVVRNNIDQIGGAIDVRSVAGEGLVFIIKIPLTLAIVSTLIVEVAGHRFAIPQSAVVELVRARADSGNRVEYIRDTPVLRLRDQLLPLVDLRRLLSLPDTEQAGAGEFVVVTQIGNAIFGVAVDNVFHTEEIVVKPMSSRLRHIDVFYGNTILGDGSVILIIDPNGIANVLGATAKTRMPISGDGSEQAGRADDKTTSLLIFRAGSAHPKAVPLSLVTRLEEIDTETVEVSNGRHMVQYRGQLMPLICVGDNVRLRSEGVQPLLVFSDGERSMALVVDEIVDIVEERLDIQVGGEAAGVLGSAIVKGQATDIIDIAHFLPMAFADWFGSARDAPPSRRKTLLLVDDSPFFRNMLTPVLQAAGYDVAVAGGGQEALAYLRRGMTVDIVVTDIDMPGMDGFALTEALRCEPATAGLPVIALSSQVSVALIERGRHVGLHDYVAKFDRAGLIAALKEQSVEVEAA